MDGITLHADARAPHSVVRDRTQTNIAEASEIPFSRSALLGKTFAAVPPAAPEPTMQTS